MGNREGRKIRIHTRLMRMTWVGRAEAAAIDTAKQSMETSFAASAGGHGAASGVQEWLVKTCGCCRQLKIRPKANCCCFACIRGTFCYNRSETCHWDTTQVYNVQILTTHFPVLLTYKRGEEKGATKQHSKTKQLCQPEILHLRPVLMH